MRALYSFPTRLGTPGIGTTAWHQVVGLAEHGVEVTVMAGSCERPLPAGVRLIETLRPIGVKIPFRALGFDRAVRLHDRLVAARVRITVYDRPDHPSRADPMHQFDRALQREHGCVDVRSALESR